MIHFLTGGYSLYLDTVRKQSSLHRGVEYHDARTLGVTLHGTGLFHFKVSLGHFETFDQVSGYFIVSNIPSSKILQPYFLSFLFRK